MKVKMQYKNCGGFPHAKIKPLKFANFQRFLWWIGCRNYHR